MVLAMGALNASMRRAGNIPVSLTLCHRSAGAIRPRSGRFPYRTDNRIELAGASRSLGGTYAGATLGTVAYGWIGGAAIWFPVVLAGLLTACSAAMPETD